MSQEDRTLPLNEAPHWQRLLIAVCFSQAIAIIGFDFTLPFIPLYLQHSLGVHGLGNVAIWAGLIGFGPAIPATILGPVWGRLADRFGYRTMLLRAMISAAILLSLMGAAPSPWILLVLRMFQGALTGTVFSSQALVAATVPERETGRAMGLLQMSISLGATMGPIGGGAVAQAMGYRMPFVGAGILLAIGSLIVFFFVQEPERHRIARKHTNEVERPSTLSVLAIPAFATALLLTLTAQLGNTSQLPVLPLYVQDLLHSTRDVASDTGWILALCGISSAGGSYLAGRLQRYVPLKPLLAVTLTLAALLCFPQALAPNYVALLLLRAVCAFAFGGSYALVGTWAAINSPREAKGTAFGLMGAASSLGFGAGPLLGGAFAAAAGIRPLFVVSAFLVGMAPVVLYAMPAWPRAVRSLRLSRAAS